MNKLCIVLFLSLLPAALLAQSGTVFDNLSLKSTLLKKEKKFALYLPPGYQSSQRHYPVVYLLHGGSDDHTGWIQFGEMQRIVDKGISEGTLAPMIVVMPDAEMTYYLNNREGKYPFEDFFMKELIPHIEQQYRAIPKKEFRAVAGLSMGGFGALLYALHHPGQFAACAAMSAAVRTDGEINALTHPEFLRRYRTALGEVKEGENRITDYWNKNSVLYLMAQLPDDRKNDVKYFLDCGDDDFLYKGNSTLHILMRERNVPHEYRVRNGGHTWEYWRTGLPDALAFISQSFHR
jgi:enterochelin esterase-like enzyme